MKWQTREKYAGSSFIKLDDVHDKQPLREQIAVVKEEDGKFGQRLILVFESGRQLSLNKTSVGNLIRDIDQDFDTWVGHCVEVNAGEDRSGERRTLCWCA